MLGVYVALFVLFILGPIVLVVVVSFTSASFIAFPIESYSVRWYQRIVEYRPFLDSLVVSLKLAASSALLGALIGVPAALALARSRTRSAGMLSTLLLAPISIPAVVLGFSLLYYLSALIHGVSFLSLLIAHTVLAIPYITRTVLSVYRSMSPDLEEAAAVLGGNRWQVLRHVTLPLVKPGIFAGAVFAILTSLDNLPISFFFGTATTNTLPVVMLSYMQNQFDPSIAAISTVQMMISVLVLLLVNRYYGIAKLNAA
ncbi:ABC transporter permease [Achromobacter aloeverae]|uniref:ABC transporter permease n=1 Tax=Achromobacter aloeverae TaxID=1750518 RepID=A0A4Q1HQR3_9BURK|nr:ABC transporter permease [Achromobacter aloeverae]